ncbi:MAG: UrcA family protein [Erythrobacter sp.]
MLKITSFAALALGPVLGPVLGLSAASPALSQNTPPSVSVSYAGLDLTSEAGRETLDRRLAQATRSVCGGKPSMRELAKMAAFRECVAATKAGYEAQRVAALKAANEKRMAFLSGKPSAILVR